MSFHIDLVPDLSEKTIVITGANSGIGLEATKIFSRKGATVIMACRSIERGENAKSKIIQEQPNANLLVKALDLGSFESIHTFAREIKTDWDHIDILLNNAGIMMTPYGFTTDGLEQQQGVNHFGHFLLTSLLIELVSKSTDGRIINISSIAHRGGKIDFDNLMYQKKNSYSSALAYGRSKLENLLFTYELASRVEKAGLPVTVLAAHPGISSTNLGHHIHHTKFYKVFHALSNTWTQSAYMGSLPGVFAATDPNAKNGTFYGPSKLFGVKGSPKVCSSNRTSKNKSLQQKLWDVSVKLTGAIYHI